MKPCHMDNLGKSPANTCTKAKASNARWLYLLGKNQPRATGPRLVIQNKRTNRTSSRDGGGSFKLLPYQLVGTVVVYRDYDG